MFHIASISTTCDEHAVGQRSAGHDLLLTCKLAEISRLTEISKLAKISGLTEISKLIEIRRLAEIRKLAEIIRLAKISRLERADTPPKPVTRPALSDAITNTPRTGMQLKGCKHPLPPASPTTCRGGSVLATALSPPQHHHQNQHHHHQQQQQQPQAPPQQPPPEPHWWQEDSLLPDLCMSACGVTVVVAGAGSKDGRGMQHDVPRIAVVPLCDEDEFASTLQEVLSGGAWDNVREYELPWV